MIPFSQIEEQYETFSAFLKVKNETPIDIKFKKLNENAVLPRYAHDGDVGMDMTAISVEYNQEHDMYIYHTGLSMESDKHYGAFLFPRSSNRKTEAYLCNHVGIVDCAIYRGEILFCFKNRDSLKTIASQAQAEEFMCTLSGKPTKYNDFNVQEGTAQDAYYNSLKAYEEVIHNPMKYAPYKEGDRVGQMVIFLYPNINTVETKEELSETERGTNGFGSTGN